MLRIILCSFVLAFSCTVAFSQDRSYYIIIGAFAIEENAQHFADQTLANNLPAVYAQNPAQKLFYVFVRVTQNKAEAYNVLKLVQDEGYRDAWIFQGSLEGGKMFAYIKPQRIPDSTAISSKPTPLQNDHPDSLTIKKAPDAVASNPTPDSTQVKKDEKKPAPVGKAFVFKLTSQATGTPLSGIVRLQEAERSPQYHGYNSNELVYVVAPTNRSKKWFLVCQVVGYEEYKKSFSYDNPKVDGLSVGSAEELIIPVPLKRVKRGDYIEMDEVKFYLDSDILKEGSERTLNELLAMMNENPKYKIRLHGHTNGDQARDLLSRGDAQSLFVPDATANKKFRGTAKQLSALRAETVKKFLTDNGIDASRILTQGEGGKQMIFDPAGTTAELNDRVEVEIIRS